MDEGQGRNKFGPKLDATTSTLPGPLSPGSGLNLNPPLVGPDLSHKTPISKGLCLRNVICEVGARLKNETLQ